MKRPLLLAPLAGATLAFSLPPWGWWPLAFLAFAALDQLLKGQARRWPITSAFAAGWLFPATFWMIDLTLPGYFTQGIIFTVFFGVTGLVIPANRWRWVALPAAFVLVEAIRWRWPFGGVPIATLPMTQNDAPLGETVRVAGPLLLGALVVLGGVGLSALYERSWRIGAGVLGAVIAIGLFAQVAPKGSVIDEIDVAIVQGGGPQGTRAINTSEREVFERHLAATELVDRPVDLVLWPEDVVNTAPSRLEASEELPELQELARELDAVLLPGIFERARPGVNRNATIALDPQGNQIDRYDKVRLVPFGEFVPLRSLIEPFAPEYLPSAEVESGTGPAILTVPLNGREATLGISISWEVFFEDRARSAMNSGAEILINPTNGSSYWLTIVQTQQVASSRLRAMETGKWVLQAAPTGFSAVISPDGELIERTSVSEQAVIFATVELRDGKTLATRLGMMPMVIVAAAALGVSLVGRTRKPAASPME